jgi:hypothetical protein
MTKEQLTENAIYELLNASASLMVVCTEINALVGDERQDKDIDINYFKNIMPTALDTLTENLKYALKNYLEIRH